MFYLLIMSILFNVLEVTGALGIIVFGVLFGTLVLFYQMHINMPYFNEGISRIQRVSRAINLWTSMMLTFALVTLTHGYTV